MKNTEVPFKEEFERFLSCLKEAKCLDYVIIIGSWAEYIYQESGLLQSFEATMKTLDLDFLIPNLRKPAKKIDLVKIAAKHQFTYNEHVGDRTSRFYGKDEFEVEFLIQQRGSGALSPVRSHIGVYPMQLTHLDMLSAFSEKVPYGSFEVWIPWPEAYVAHKMIINNRRGMKAAADREKIEHLMPYLNREKAGLVFNSLTKKEQGLFVSFQKDFNMILME